MAYRQKKYTCGNYLDVEIFNVPDRHVPLKRARRMKESTPAQMRLNSKNAEKYIARKVHANFTEKDLYVDLTFEGQLPRTRQEARRHIVLYIGRLNYWRKKLGLPPLKYLYVISNTDDNGNKVRLHIHMIINDMDRDLAERLWRHGRANTDRLQFNEYGVTGKSLYMARQARDVEVPEDIRSDEKSWSCSKNLKNPEPVVSDKAVTTSMANKMLSNPGDREYFEKLYPGWVFTDCEITIDDCNGMSFYIRLRRYDDEKEKARERVRDKLGGDWLRKHDPLAEQLSFNIGPRVIYSKG